MWKPGSMGWHHGWHYGQAHEMLEHMHDHARYWQDPLEGGSGNPISDFLSSFAERMGENVADKVMEPSSDNG